MKKTNIKCKKPFLIFFAVFLFTSCSVHISLKPIDSGAEFNLSLDMGKAFLEMISSVAGMEKSDAFAVVDCNELKTVLSEADFYDVSVRFEDEKTIKIGGKFDWNSNNPLVLSKMVAFAQQNGVRLTFSTKTLQSLHTLLPQDFKNYLDMFMAPSFTGEEMTDGEYMDLLASVYGDALVEELKSAKITLTVLGNGQKPIENTLSLVKILNIIGELRI